MAATFPSLPRWSRIVCRETARGLVLHLPPASRQALRLMAWMTVWGLAAPGLFLWLFFPAVFRDPWTTIFWTVPVGFFELLGASLLWRKMLRRTFVLLEPGRLVVSSVLFGQERLKEYDLTDESRAELVVASKDDGEQPVYAIAVGTANGAARFDEILSGEEQRWLVRRINLHLGGASPGPSQGKEKGPEYQ